MGLYPPGNVQIWTTTSNPALNTSTFQTVSITHTATSTAHIEIQIGAQNGGGAQTTGTAIVKNFQVTRTISPVQVTTFSGYLEATGQVLGLNFVSTSDEAIKENVADASEETCLDILKAVNMKTYNRTDIPGSRLGVIAQELQSQLPVEFANLVIPKYGEPTLLTLDYSRLACLLWQACRQMEKRISALEA